VSASPARRRYARGARFIRPDIARIPEHEEKRACVFPLPPRCPTCDIPLTYTITRDGETLCLMDHVQPKIEWSERYTIPFYVTYDATCRKTKSGRAKLW
jgi:hypothetical protein